MNEVTDPLPEDAIIIKLFPTLTYADIGKKIGWSTQKTAGRGYRLGLRRYKTKRAYSEEIPATIKTPDQGDIAKLRKKWA